MKRALWLSIIFCLVLPVVSLIGCSSEMDEDDWVDALRDKRTRDQALMYVQEHRTKKAVPVLLSLIQKRYSTLKAIYTLGIIGDPVAVPPLLEVLNSVVTKDSLDHDRMSEQICMALGMIGNSTAVPPMIKLLDNPQSGEMGRAGAVQAIGMIGDPRGTEKLIEVLKNEKEKLLIRHYAAIALGRIKAKEAADALVYALYVDDETGRNLFRDGQLSLLQIGGEAARNALIKGYELKNEDVTTVAKKIELKDEWVKIKAINVMGQLRDPKMADFMMGELDKALKNELVYEIEAKLIQALAFTPLSKEQKGKIADAFLKRVTGTEFLNERELLSQVLIKNNATEKLDDIMKLAEAGDIRMKNAKGQYKEFSQHCVAAANIVSLLGDQSFADRFDAFVKEGKCVSDIWGLKKKTPELLAEFNQRMKAAKECGNNMACWQGKLASKDWPVVEKAVMTLANTGDNKYMPDIMKVLTFPNQQVREATEYAIWKLATPELLPQLIRYWQDQKINREFQKVTENIGYIIFLHMRDWNMDSPEKRREVMREAEALRGTGKGLLLPQAEDDLAPEPAN